VSETIDDEAPSITCPDCGTTTNSPNYVRYGYCGECGWWTTKTDERRLDAWIIGVEHGVNTAVVEETVILGNGSVHRREQRLDFPSIEAGREFLYKRGRVRVEGLNLMIEDATDIEVWI